MSQLGSNAVAHCITCESLSSSLKKILCDFQLLIYKGTFKCAFSKKLVVTIKGLPLRATIFSSHLDGL